MDPQTKYQAMLRSLSPPPPAPTAKERARGITHSPATISTPQTLLVNRPATLREEETPPANEVVNPYKMSFAPPKTTQAVHNFNVPISLRVPKSPSPENLDKPNEQSEYQQISLAQLNIQASANAVTPTVKQVHRPTVMGVGNQNEVKSKSTLPTAYAKNTVMLVRPTSPEPSIRNVYQLNASSIENLPKPMPTSTPQSNPKPAPAPVVNAAFNVIWSAPKKNIDVYQALVILIKPNCIFLVSPTSCGLFVSR
jgi:hypothetical protein